jgi:peptidoglycan/xylan/chitin deacetylase (PgdA/CDA1 family)
MLSLRRIALAVAVTLTVASLSASLAGQTKTVAVTIDDLPFVSGDDSRGMLPADATAAAASNHKLLATLARHHVPVTGFVIQSGVEALGLTAGTKILKEWTKGDFDLANHSYLHPDSNDLTVAEFEDQITRGEATYVPLMKAAGKQPEFFRFPNNHTGDTKEKHDALAVFLAQHGYKLAPCTIETSDWLFNATYFRAHARHDEATAARLRADYLAFTAAQVDYYDKLDRQVLGYDAPQIMVLHDNPLNADVMDAILKLFEQRGYRFVTLAEAERDPIYQAPDTFVTRFGPMWAYRWARVKGIKVDGSLEPDPPKWITEYGAK